MDKWKTEWTNGRLGQGDTAGGGNRLGFLQHLDGSEVSKAEQSTITEFAKKLWNELYWHDVDPATWGKALDSVSEWFCAKICERYPIFAACDDGRWKAKAFAVAKYSDWCRDTRSTNAVTRDPSILGS